MNRHQKKAQKNYLPFSAKIKYFKEVKRDGGRKDKGSLGLYRNRG